MITHIMERGAIILCVLFATIINLEVRGEADLPSFVIVLTDDQDLVLNGMVMV